MYFFAKFNDLYLFRYSFCNILLTIILLGIGCDLVFRSAALEDPLNVNGEVADLGVYMLLAFCLFNVALILTGVTSHTKSNKFILLSQYSVGILTLIAIGTTKENAGALVVALFMIGDVVFAESRNMLRAKKDNYSTTSMYKVALFYHFTGAMIFRVALPTLIMVVIAVYQHWKLLKMSSPSVVIFFIAISFYFVTNIWTVKIVFSALLSTRTKDGDVSIEIETCEEGWRARPQSRNGQIPLLATHVRAEPNNYVQFNSIPSTRLIYAGNIYEKANSLPVSSVSEDRRSIDTTVTVLDGVDNLSVEIEKDNWTTVNLYDPAH